MAKKLKPRMIDLNNLILIRDIEKIFGVSTQSVYKWRKSLGLDDKALVPIPGDVRDTLRYDLEKVLEWAADTNRTPTNLKTWKKATGRA